MTTYDLVMCLEYSRVLFPSSGQVGTFSLAGTVTYSLYPTNDCSGTASTTDAEAVTSSGSVTASSLSAALAAGGYSYKAVYGGNGNYSGSNSGCEPFNVDEAATSIGTTVKDGSGNTVSDAAPATYGASIRDTAVLGGQVGSFSFAGSLGTVSYVFFTSHDCSTGSSAAETVTVGSTGSVPYSSLKPL